VLGVSRVLRFRHPLRCQGSRTQPHLTQPTVTRILVLTYRDGIRHAEAAHMLGMSQRNIYYLLPAARRLADSLDRLDLL
jgi:hypothetical protein